MESSQSIAGALGLPAFPALLLGNLSAPLPPGVEQVYLAFDNDERGAGPRVRLA